MASRRTLTHQCWAICYRVCDRSKSAATTMLRQIERNEIAPPEVIGVILPMLTCRDVLRRERRRPERFMKELARELPIWPWAEGVLGLGPLSLAQLISETGPLDAYATVSRVWKRMGLAVIDGKRQRRIRGKEGIAQGFSPRRRALMHVIGVNIIRARCHGESEYVELYETRKSAELVKENITQGHAHSRALRYMEKRLLRDAWIAWEDESLAGVVR